MIETKRIVTPVRLFCKEKARFYEADVKSIDPDKKEVIITYSIGKQSQPISFKQRILRYDHLVIALGSENNFFGMIDIEESAFTMTTIDDAFISRNHIINILERASNLDTPPNPLRYQLLFSGFY